MFGFELQTNPVSGPVENHMGGEKGQVTDYTDTSTDTMLTRTERPPPEDTPTRRFSARLLKNNNRIPDKHACFCGHRSVTNSECLSAI